MSDRIATLIGGSTEWLSVAVCWRPTDPGNKLTIVRNDKKAECQSRMTAIPHGNDEKNITQVQVRRLGCLDEIAGAVAYPVSGNMAFITGSDLFINDGQQYSGALNKPPRAETYV